MPTARTVASRVAATRRDTPTVTARPPGARQPARDARSPGAGERPSNRTSPARSADRPPDPILFQQFFKSVGPRTYAAQVKTAGNGNPYLVLTEGKRDDATGEVRKTRLFVFSEDFEAFLSLLHDTERWLRTHPVPPDIREQRRKFWAKRAAPTPAATAAIETATATIPVSRAKPANAASRLGGCSSPAPAPTTRRPPATQGAPATRLASTWPRTAGRFAAAHPPLVASPS